MAEADHEDAAALHVVAEDPVLLRRTGVPAGEHEDLVVLEQMLRRDVVAREGRDVAQAVGRGGEVDVLVRREHRRHRHHGLADRVPAHLGQAMHPVRVLAREVIRAADGRPGDVAAAAQVEVALRERPGRLGLALRRGIPLAEGVEVADDVAVLRRDGRAVVDVGVALLGLLEDGLLVLLARRLVPLRAELATGDGHH